MRDGDIDYSKYTLLELEEALAGINKQKYPENYSNLRSAHERLTASLAAVPRPDIIVTPASDPVTPAPRPGLWERFWDSRPISALLGIICLWWAYDLFAHSASCPSGRKLLGSIVAAVCENSGHAVAAGIPFILGLLGISYAVLPRRRAGA